MVPMKAPDQGMSLPKSIPPTTWPVSIAFTLIA